MIVDFKSKIMRFIISPPPHHHHHRRRQQRIFDLQMRVAKRVLELVGNHLNRTFPFIRFHFRQFSIINNNNNNNNILSQINQISCHRKLVIIIIAIPTSISSISFVFCLANDDYDDGDDNDNNDDDNDDNNDNNDDYDDDDDDNDDDLIEDGGSGDE